MNRRIGYKDKSSFLNIIDSIIFYLNYRDKTNIIKNIEKCLDLHQIQL